MSKLAARVLISTALLVGTAHPGRADGLTLDSYSFATLDVLTAVSGTTEAFAINDRGEVVGDYGDAAGFHGFLYSGGSFTTIDILGADYTIAYGINNNSQIVGASGPSSSALAGSGFLYSGGGVTTINAPGSSRTYITGINDTGQVVGMGISGNNSAHAFLYDGSSFTTIAIGESSDVQAINNRGQAVGIYNDTSGTAHGYVYSGGSFTTIDIPGGTANFYGINDRGQISGSYSDATGSHGFVYDGGTLITINFPGVPSRFCPTCPTSTSVYGINNLGQVVGRYSDSTGTHSFVATPIPEPGTLALLLLGSGVFMTWRRHRIRGSAQASAR